MQKESQQTINALRNMTRKDEQLDQKRFMRIKEGCLNGIESVKTNAADAVIE